MKYKITLKCDGDYLFDFLLSDIRNTYNKTKKSKDIDIHKGLIFTTEVELRKKQKKLATVKVLEYDKPTDFSMDYRSSDYHKITSLHINKINDNNCELIYEIYEEMFRNGKVYKTDGSHQSNEIKKAGLKDRIQYLRIASALRNKKKEDEKTKS